MILLQIINHKITTTILVIVNLIIFGQILPLFNQAHNKIYFLDVGQGASTLIQTNNSQQILIDGGPDDQILEKLNSYLPLSDKNIELVILTHPHADHLNGLQFVMENYHINQILLTNAEYENNLYEHFKEKIDSIGIKKIIARAGQKIIVHPNIEIEILYPNKDLSQNIDINDTSIALTIKSDQNKIILTGDNSQKIENELVEKYQSKIDIDILQVGHHGSKNSSSNDFLEQTSPNIAVISCGTNNQFNHPHPETIDILNIKQINIKQTNINGDIDFDL